MKTSWNLMTATEKLKIAEDAIQRILDQEDEGDVDAGDEPGLILNPHERYLIATKIMRLIRRQREELNEQNVREIWKAMLGARKFLREHLSADSGLQHRPMPEAARLMEALNFLQTTW